MKTRSNYSSHVGLWRIHTAQPPKPNPRVEAYVKDQMQDFYERINEEMGYSD